MAGVIRKETCATRAAFSFADLEGEAARIVRDARVEASRIIADARTAAETLGRQATREGAERGAAEARVTALESVRREAFDKMLAESRQHLSDLSTSLAGAMDRFERSKSGLLAAAERRVVELAIGIARRVCKIDVGRDSAAVAANASTLLNMAQHEHDLRLLVSSADFALLQQVLPELVSSIDQRKHVTLLADPEIQRGDCRLVGASGTIDASIMTQLDRVAIALCDGVPSALAGAPVVNTETQPPPEEEDPEPTGDDAKGEA